MLSPGDTFLIPKPGQRTAHLWVVLASDDDGAAVLVLAVNLTTRRHGSDLTTILRPGDHPFVTHETVVNYADARWMPADILETALQRRSAEPRAPCSAALRQRIEAGLLVSRYTPRGIQAWWRQRQARGE